MSIFINNYTAQNIFEGMNLWKADGQYGVTDLPFGEWQEKKDAFLIKNLNIVNSVNGQRMPLNDMAHYATNSQSAFALNNVNDSLYAWERLEKITAKGVGSGTIYAFDTETFGDVTIASKVAKGEGGITELGLARGVYENGQLIDIQDYSIPIKPSTDQVSYIESVITKFTEGKNWNDLSNAEQVTLNRISMYRGAKVKNGYIDFMGATNGAPGMSIVHIEDLMPEMGKDLKAVRAGLDFLKNYGMSAEVIMPEYKKLLLGAAQGENTVIAAANSSKFDLPVLRAHGYTDEEIKSLNAGTTDITMGQTVIATAENITTFELNERAKGAPLVRHTRDSGTVGAMNEAAGYDEITFHIAGKDAKTTLRIATIQEYLDGKSYARTVIDSHLKQLENLQSIKDGIILVNGGFLDKNAIDQVRIGDEVTHSYSISRGYWTFDEAKSGFASFTPEGSNEAQEVFIASFKSAATGEDNFEFSKSFASIDDFYKWMSYNTSVLNRESVTQEQIDTESKYHSSDFGRREFSRFFEADATAKAGNADEHGYASLSKYLNAYDDVSKFLKEQGIDNPSDYLYTTEGANSISDILSKHGIKTNFQQRAFVGMYGKLQDESDVLKYIVDYASTVQTEKESSNLIKTRVVRDMHDKFIDAMDKNIQGSGPNPNSTYLLSDALSIDLKGADGKYHVVSATSPVKLVSGIRRLYENKTSRSTAASLARMSTLVDDLFSRELIDKNTQEALKTVLKNNPSMHNASTAVANALSYIFEPLKNSSDTITAYEQVMTGNSTIDDALQQAIRAKNIDAPPSVALQQIYGTKKILGNGAIVTANDYYNNESVKNTLQGQMAEAGAIAQSKNVTFENKLNVKTNKAVKNELISKLGYSDTQIGIIDSLFNATKNDNGSISYKDYAFNGWGENHGVMSTLITPEEAGNSGYIVFTNKQNASRVTNILADKTKDLSRKEMEELLDGKASFLELKAFHKIKIGDVPEPLQALYGSDEAFMTFVDQGTSTIRYMHPELNLYVANGIINGGLREAGSDILQSFSLTAKNALQSILAGNFPEGTKTFNSALSRSLSEKSDSSSYQGLLDESGDRIRARSLNQSDVKQGLLFKYKEGLETARNHLTTLEDNDFTKLLRVFNEGYGIQNGEKIVESYLFDSNPTNAYNKILNSAAWKNFEEIYMKENLSNNHLITLGLTSKQADLNLTKDTFDTTLIGLIANSAERFKGKHFSDSSVEALRTLEKSLPYLSQNLTESLIGYFSILDPGSFYATAPGSGVNRPTFGQRDNARNMKIEDLPHEYLERVGGVADSLMITPNTKRRKELFEEQDLRLPDGTKYSDTVSSVTLTSKQMSDAQFLNSYTKVKEDLESYAEQLSKEYGESYDDVLLKLKDAYEAQVKAAPTIYGDSAAVSATMATKFHELGLDTKKLEFDGIQRLKERALNGDTKAADSLAYTSKKLKSLEGKVVRKGDVIGHDGYKLIYWDGFETKLTSKNVSEILDEGKTAITPLNTIAGRKLFLGGVEKFMGNGVVVDDNFLSSHSFANKKEALKYLDFIFERVAGAPTDAKEYIPSIITNLSIAKHISGNHLQTSLYLIVNEYKKAGMLESLAETMRAKGYENWNPSLYKDHYDKLLADTENTHFSYDVARLVEDISNNRFGNAEVNKKLSGLFDYFVKNNMGFNDAQSNIQTQIMGDKLRMDPRVEAAYRRRYINNFILSSGEQSSQVYGDIINYEKRIVDKMNSSIRSGKNDYIRARDLGDKDDIFNKYVERFSKQESASLARQRQKVKEQEKVVSGIKEAIDYFSGKTDISNKNIVTFTMEELMEKVPQPTRENLGNFIFKKNGQFTEDFINKMKASGLSPETETLTALIKLDKKYTIDINGKTESISEFLVPLYNIYDDFSDAADLEESIGFTNSIGDFMNFFQVYKDNVHSIDANDISEVANSITRYAISLTKELSTDDKTSLLYKVAGRYIMPNSTYLLGQDEIAPVIADMLDFSNNVEIAKNEIRDGKINAQSLKNLSDAYRVRESRLGAIKEAISKNPKELKLYGNELIGYANYTQAANGGFLNVNAVNRNTFEQRLNFDIGLFGKSLFEDIKGNKGEHIMTMGTRTFNLNIKEAEKQVAENLQKIDGFEYTGNISDDITKYMITIEDLNKALVEQGNRAQGDEILNNAVKAVNAAFDFIGVKFLKEIGITTNLTVRHPAFGVGVGPANIILDDSVGNEQLRILGPGYSKTMNLDHDGDTMGIAIDNAALAMKKNTAGMLDTLNAIEKNALVNFDIITKMITDGDAFAVDNVADIYFNESVVLKTYRETEYNEAIDSFIKNNNIQKGDYADEAIEFMAAYSPEMRRAVNKFNSKEGNFLKSAEATIAALQAKITKDNIGLISTASFSLHDAVSVAFEQAATAEEKTRIARLHSYMDYIGENGMSGLLTLAEQKGIDTKHILNATQITNVNDFGKGIAGLMNTNADVRRDNIQKNLFNVMSSINHALYKERKTNKELLEIADRIVKTSMEEYDGLINKAADSKEAENLVVERMMRALYELSEIATVRSAFNNETRRKGRSFADFVRGLTNLSEYDSGDNLTNKARKLYENASDIKLGLKTDTVYATGGTVFEQSRMYTLSKDHLTRLKDGRLKLSLTDINSGEEMKIYGMSMKNVMEKVDSKFAKYNGEFISINSKLLKEDVDVEAINIFNKNKQKAKTISTLNEFFAINPDGSQANYNTTHGFLGIGKSLRQSITDDIGEEYFKILTNFAETSPETIANTHDFVKFLISQDKRIEQLGYEGLIEKLNQHIVDHPENYAGHTTFSKAVMDTAKSVIDDVSYNSYVERYYTMGQLKINPEDYTTIVDEMRKNIYNITEEHDTLLDELDVLKQYANLGIDDITNGLETLPDAIDTHIQDLTIKQSELVHSSEQKVYDLLKSSKGVDTVFGLNKVNDNTKIGFGEYIGISFKDLNEADINKILNSAKQNASYYNKNVNSISSYAYNKTVSALKEWSKSHAATSEASALNYGVSQQTAELTAQIRQLKILGENNKKITDTIADKSANRKTLGNIGLDAAKDFLSKNKKALGIAAASMAAIGITNNILHNQKNKSPLMPANLSKEKSFPGFTSPTSSEPNKTSAPSSKQKQKTVYHNNSGFRFKVSANTRNYIDDQNNAKLIGMSGGGDSYVYSQSDTSGVTDNWLANKFAELM